MAITYTSGGSAHTDFTTFLVSESLAAQTGGADEVQIAATTDASPSNATGYTANVGDGSNGLGDTFVGRLAVLRKNTATEEIRMISAASYAASVTTITVTEDWDTAPTTSDQLDVCYELADAEDGGAGGGMALSAKSGLWEMASFLYVTSGGGLQLVRGDPLELDDRGSGVSLDVNSGGYLFSGYGAAGADVSGGLIISYNGTTGEPSVQVDSGGFVRMSDTLIWAQKVGQQFECANGSDGIFKRTKWLNNSDELHLYDATIEDCAVAGKGASTDIVRVDAGTSCDGLVLDGIDKLDSVADTTVETLELEGVLFADVTNFVDVRQNRTWNLIDPIWSVTTYTELTWSGTSTGNELNDRKAIKVTAQEADGTKLQDALVNVYEHTQLADLVLELLTAATTGYVEDSFIYKKHATNSVTTTYGGHALQCGKWLYKPFVAAQISTENFVGTIVLSDDANIVQTTQATAESAGSGISWNEDTNPSEVFAFTSGSGTLAVGMILTFSPSGAVGTITESLSGNSTSGEIHLDTRTSTAIANSDTFSRTGGTAGTFSGTYTNDSKQPFSIHIDGNSLSYQTIYDYLAAIQNKTTLGTDGELIWEWCRSAQTQPLYATGSSFYTEQSNSKGIIVINAGAGTADYFTDDSGTVWNPPTSVDVTITCKDVTGAVVVGAQVGVFLTSDGTEIINADTNGSGVASTSYTDTTPVEVKVWVRKASSGATKYLNFSSIQNISVTGLSLAVTLVEDPNNNATT